MWIFLPKQPGRGNHSVWVPADFNMSPFDFATVGDFLNAVREHHMKNPPARR